MLHIPLLVLSIFCAAEEPQKLEPAATIKSTFGISGLRISRDFTLAAHANNESAIVWRLSDGKQVARVPMPKAKPALPKESEFQGFKLLDISPDGKRLLISRTQRVAMTGGKYSATEMTALLVNIEDGSAKPLLSRRMGCRWYDNTGISLNICEDGDGTFLSDGKGFAFSVKGYPSSAFRVSMSKSIYDCAFFIADSGGKILKTFTARLEEMISPSGEKLPSAYSGEKGIFGVDLNGSGRLLAATQDEGSCEVRDLASGKHVSFLEDCTERVSLRFDRGGLVYSQPDQSQTPEKERVKIWDTASGGLLFTSTDTKLSAARAAQADAAFLYFPDSRRFEIRDGSLKRVLAAAAIPGEDNPRLEAASPDGSRIAVSHGDQTTIYKTCLGASLVSAAPAPEEIKKPAVEIDSPPAAKSKIDPNAYAIVIGLEKYRQEGIPAVDFASHDAHTMYDYLTRAMGFDAKNVILLTDDRATKTDLEKYLGPWLANRADEKSRVFIYYAGHGAPNPVTGEGYLMPYEADPNYPDATAFPVAKLYAALAKLPTKDVTVVLDACFSGQGGRSLIAKGARPLVVSIKSAAGPDNAIVLAAATGGQISASDPARRHGLLTEYILEALHGAADQRGDGQITADEIYAYVRPAVERAARLQNIEQTPTLSASPEAAKGSHPWIWLK